MTIKWQEDTVERMTDEHLEYIRRGIRPCCIRENVWTNGNPMAMELIAELDACRKELKDLMAAAGEYLVQPCSNTRRLLRAAMPKR